MKRPLLVVVEDDAKLRNVLVLALGNHGYEVRAAGSGREALALIGQCTPDAVVLDLGLPDMDGYAVTTAIRREHELPIVILSAAADEQAQVHALDCGANDFIAKPFRERELMARLRAALRRPANVDDQEQQIVLGDLRIERHARRVYLAGNELKLTRTELDLLEVLALRAHRVVTHEQLLLRVWGAEHVREVHYLRVYVKLLRKKLEEDPAKPKRLLTALGVGYRLVDPSAVTPNAEL
jgi:two-component system KDP operon response regulator KdpE